jgi:hypothetical protein
MGDVIVSNLLTVQSCLGEFLRLEDSDSAHPERECTPIVQEGKPAGALFTLFKSPLKVLKYSWLDILWSNFLNHQNFNRQIHVPDMVYITK